MVKKQKVEKDLTSKKDLSKPKSLSLEESNLSLENELEFPTSLNQELEELLKKDKKRFFGGCGG
jgi:hypothetical protein